MKRDPTGSPIFTLLSNQQPKRNFLHANRKKNDRFRETESESF